LKRRLPRLVQRTTSEAPNRSPNHSGKYIRRVHYHSRSFRLPKTRSGKERTMPRTNMQLVMTTSWKATTTSRALQPHYPKVLAFSSGNPQSKQPMVLLQSLNVDLMTPRFLNLSPPRCAVLVHPLLSLKSPSPSHQRSHR
jgi:hypothetical protein